MTSPPAPDPSVAIVDPVTRRPRRKQTSFTGRVLLTLLGRWGARAAAVWIGVVGLLAVIAPLIASSHPIAFYDGEAWSSPMLEHLTSTDWTLLIAGAAAVLFAIAKRYVRHASDWPLVRAWLAILLVTGLATYVFPGVSPPQTVVYSQYREALAANPKARAIHTLIPFSPSDRLRDRPDSRYLEPSATHWLGTTQYGEDMLSRMIHACRIALAIGFIATGIAVAIGVVVGGLMGYFSGVVDLIGMRLVEIFSAIPVIFILIMIVAFYGRNLYLMMVVIGLFGWVGYAEFTRAEFLKLRKLDYVQAAIALGVPLRSVLLRHMLPNGLTPVVVTASFGVAGAILTEATLSFLGLGLVDEPSWGQLLQQARDGGGGFKWWLAFPPGLAIFLTVFAYNLMGEALRDAIDPRTQIAGKSRPADDSTEGSDV